MNLNFEIYGHESHMENVAGEQCLPLQKLFHASLLLRLAKRSHSNISDTFFSISVIGAFYFMKVY